MPLHLTLIEPVPLLRHALRHLLEAQPELEVTTLEAPPPVCTGDLQIVNATFADLLLPGTSLPTLLLDGHAAPCDLRRWINAGAAGIVTLTDSPGILLQAVKDIADGVRPWISTGAAARLLEEAAAGLTEREMAVLCLLAEGRSHGEICDQLFIAEGTLRNHLSAIYRKLGVEGGTQAVAWAWRHHLVKLS